MTQARSSTRPRRRWELLEARLPLAGDVVLNEFMAANSDTLRDFAGDSSDWIELHNPTANSIDLAGWRLSDDADDLSKWEFPSRVIEAGGYLVVFASGKDVSAGAELHTNFRLSAGGEFLSLTLPDGATIASSYSPEFPLQQQDVSYGFAGDDAQSRAGYLLFATPGAANSAHRLEAAVTFSSNDATFTDAFLLTLGGAGLGQSIVYTLDGSVPTLASPVYTEPLLIDRTLQVRARVADDFAAMGPVRTEGFSRLSPAVAEFAAALPIMLIENFGAGQVPNKGFPDQTGANTFQQPRQSAMLSLFEPADSLNASSRFSPAADVHARIGIRARGAFSTTFDEPSYSLEFWDEADGDVDLAPLGLTSDADWVLYAPNPNTDFTLIDNTFLFTISNQFGKWAPAFRYVETFLNTGGDDVTLSDYVGLYVFEDKVSRGEDRLDFERFAPDGASGGWLLTVNRMDAIPADDVTAAPQYFHTAGPDGILQTQPNSPGVGDDIPRQYNAFLNFEDPGGYDITRAQRTAIETWFEQMEQVLYGRTAARWNDPLNGYPKYIDVDSFIDYFILNNLSKNGDAFLLSMFLYNPDPARGGKLTMGPIWDADLGSYQGSPTAKLRRDVDRLWYTRMFEDPDFVQQHTDRWFSLRSDILSVSHMNQVIDGLSETITPEAAVRDGVLNWPQRLSEMKSWLSRRAAAIDGLFLQPVTFDADGDVGPTQVRVSTVGGGTVYYTLDGSDPRERGGAVASTAALLSGNLIDLDASATVTARLFADGQWSAPTRATFSVVQPGDVNDDGRIDAGDIDVLLAAAALGDFRADLDLNVDRVVDASDVRFLVETLLRTRVGDANLDGRVDFTDFLRVAENFGNSASWSDGNFDFAPVVEFADFLALAENFGFERSLAQAANGG